MRVEGIRAKQLKVVKKSSALREEKKTRGLSSQSSEEI
jgi:hypothetical protein